MAGKATPREANKFWMLGAAAATALVLAAFFLDGIQSSAMKFWWSSGLFWQGLWDSIISTVGLMKHNAIIYSSLMIFRLATTASTCTS